MQSSITDVIRSGCHPSHLGSSQRVRCLEGGLECRLLPGHLRPHTIDFELHVVIAHKAAYRLEHQRRLSALCWSNLRMLVSCFDWKNLSVDCK